MIQLRDYQKESIKAIKKEWRDGNRRTLLVLPTGCGKTVVFNTLAKELASDGGRVLILAHREELLTQAVDKFDGDAGFIKGAITDVKQVTVGSIQTLSRRKWSGDEFDYIIVDEAHHTLSDSYLKFLNQFPDALILGVTATADRGDKKSLSRFYDSLAYEYKFRQAVQEGYLVRPVARCIPLQIDLSKVTVKVGDFEVNSLSEALEPYLPQIAIAIKEYASDRKTIVFTPLIHIAQEMRDELLKVGLDAREVNGQSEDRKEVLDWFSKSGKGSVLVNSALLLEGFDEPSVDCVVMLRPTKIRSLYAQAIGRGTRLYPGKENLLILDFLWLTQRHDLCRPASLITENQTEREYIKAKTETDEIDLFNSLSDAEEARREALARELAKQKAKKAKLIDPMQFFVTIGDLSLEDYEPIFPWMSKDPTEAQVKLLEQFGLNHLDFDRGKASLVINTLLGRKNLATPKQVMFLKKFGYHPENWTKDMASKKITALKAVKFQRWRLHD